MKIKKEFTEGLDLVKIYCDGILLGHYIDMWKEFSTIKHKYCNIQQTLDIGFILYGVDNLKTFL